MKHTPTILLVVCLSVSIWYYYTHAPGLNGHWHLQDVNVSEQDHGQYELLDIENDTFAYWGGNGFGSYFRGTRINQEDQVLDFGGECWGIRLKYKLSMGELLLEELGRDENPILRYIGKRCNDNCCDEEQEFFRYSKLAIDLPLTDRTTNGLRYEDIEMSLARNAYFGKAKPNYAHVYGVDMAHIQLGDKVSSPEDLALWRAQHLIKLRESSRNQTFVILYIDANTSIKDLIGLIERIRATSNDQLYLALNTERSGFIPQYELIPTEKQAMNVFLSTWFK